MRDIDCNALLVRDGERTGIVTGMNLSKAVVLKGMTIDEPVKSIAQFDLVTVEPDDFVSQALLLMTKHNKRRVVVKEGERFRRHHRRHQPAELSSPAIRSWWSAASIAPRRLQELGAAAKQIADQVRPLRRQGVKFEVVAEILSDLNRRLFAKLFDLLCPAEMRDKTCLIVMGSEGRGEQTIRTDQDNGLILSEPVDEAALQPLPHGVFRRAGEVRLPALSRPCDGRQSALVAHARRICLGFQFVGPPRPTSNRR